jgi:hypothetical protein
LILATPTEGRRLLAVAHEHADYVVAGLLEQVCRHAAVDAAGHGQDYTGHERSGVRKQV